jgi:hypothetical protein
MTNRTNWAAQLVFGCLVVLMSLVALAADTKQPVVVPELMWNGSATGRSIARRCSPT